jgi:ribosome-associated protein
MIQGAMIQVTGTITIDPKNVDERFIRASGPGGQNVNKVATAVELRFDVARSSLPEDVKARLMSLAGKRMTAEGVLLIDSRGHRTQAQNREAAHERLIALVRRAAVRPTRRRQTKPTAAVLKQRLIAKRRRAAVKARRSSRPSDEE